MSVKIKLRLPVPEGRPGDVVEVSSQRAEALVDRRYATFVSVGSVPDPTPVVTADVEAVTTDTGASPVTELPASTDNKAAWEAAAASLGIDTDGYTKAQIIEAVTEATS